MLQDNEGQEMSEKLKELEEKRKRVGEQLGRVGDMRQGSLSARYLKCGKPLCRCTKEKSYSHGPHFSLTKAVKGKTVTRTIPKEAVESTKAQIARYQDFRKLSQEFLAVNEEICDAKLTESGGNADQDQKKSSKRSSKLRLSEKSKNS